MGFVSLTAGFPAHETAPQHRGGAQIFVEWMTDSLFTPKPPVIWDSCLSDDAEILGVQILGIHVLISSGSLSSTTTGKENKWLGFLLDPIPSSPIPHTSVTLTSLCHIEFSMKKCLPFSSTSFHLSTSLGSRSLPINMHFLYHGSSLRKLRQKENSPPMNFQAWEVFIGQMSINDEGDGKSRASWWCQWVVGKCVGSRMDIISC